MEIEVLPPACAPAEVPANYVRHNNLSAKAGGLLQQMAKGDVTICYETVLVAIAKLWHEVDVLHRQEVPPLEKPHHRTWRNQVAKQARERAEEGRRFTKLMTDVMESFGKQQQVMSQQYLEERSAAAQEKLAEAVENARAKKDKTRKRS